MNFRPYSLLVLAVLMLTSCGEGYVLEPGRLAIVADEPLARDQVLSALSRNLAEEGFDNLGRHDEMIDLINSGTMEASTKEQQIARLRREYNYLNKTRNLSVTATDYTDVELSTVQLRYTAPYKRFVEVAIYEQRPGGFSQSGLTFFQKLRTTLQATYPQGIAVINEPPETNEAEYRRITSVNFVSSVVAWLIALVLSLAIIGIPLYYLMKRLPLPLGAKRALFALICTVLVAPVPLPATIVVVPGPNIFLFPWTDFSYYKAWGPFVPISFVATLTICAAISLKRFRAVPVGEEAQRSDA